MSEIIPCTTFSLDNALIGTSIEQDIFMTRHCIPSTVLLVEYALSLVTASLFVLPHIFILIRKLSRSPEFVETTGFKLIVLQLVAFTIHGIGIVLLITHDYAWLISFTEGVAWAFVTWTVSILSYSFIMTLDGMNLEAGTMNQEKITRRYWKSIVIRHSIDTCITISLSAAAAYFKYTNQRIPNVICCALIYLSSAILVIASDFTMLFIKSRQVVRILKGVVDSQGGKSSSSSDKTTRTLQNLDKVLKWVVLVGYAALLGTLVLPLWGLITINGELGMAWSSPVVIGLFDCNTSIFFYLMNRLFTLYV